MRIMCVLLIFTAFPPSCVLAGEVSISTSTRTYRVSGSTVQAVVRSMKHNGPNSELHGRRALGMADYRYRARLRTSTRDGRCHVEDASIKMRISYILPRLSRHSRLPPAHLRRWKKIHSMIERHEHQHGRYYRQFAG